MDNNLEEKKAENIIDTKLEDIMGKDFIDYAMYVIVDRALPSVKDGLKPVHRRILWSMHTLDNKHNKPYKKSARIVGDVIGKYHPHGDTAVYDAMVRMAQPFSMRVPLVDGQGNFGSIDGDSPAAMRYTESRMSIFAEKMFSDIEKDTVGMTLNYDGTEYIPESLPLRFPNLLINGSEGIAVAMATHIPPHNPIETLNAVNYIVDKKINVDINVNMENYIDELMPLIPAPDFPTGGIIHNLKEMKSAWLDGRASLKLRCKWHTSEDLYGNAKIIITEIPYQIEKEKLIKVIADLASPNKDKDGKIEIEGIKEVQDFSSKKGLEIEISLKKDFDPQTVFIQLAKMTNLETSINYNNTVLINDRPVVSGILTMLTEFISHRVSVIERRTTFLLKKSKERQHILSGLIKALSVLDEVIALIKSSDSNQDAKSKLMTRLEIDEIQAESILRMQLRSLASSEIIDLENEFNDINLKVSTYENILSNPIEVLNIIKEETEEQIQLFSSEKNYVNKSIGERVSEFVHAKLDTDLAALTKEEESTVFFSKKGYIRRMPLTDLQMQNRGTTGKKYMNLQKDDHIAMSINCHSHDELMFISNTGQVYSLYAYELTDTEKGRHINNIVEIGQNENISIMLPVDYSNEDQYLIMVTKNGIVKKTKLTEYSNSFRKSGLRGISIRDNDEILFAKVVNNEDDLIIASSNNKVIRFEVTEDSVRNLSRTASGVKGMNLNSGHVVSAEVIKNNESGYLVSVTENGIIKITDVDQYRSQSRGGKGLSVMKSNERTGNLFGLLFVNSLDLDIVITTKSGISNRISLHSIKSTNRFTSGVKLLKLRDSDKLVDIFTVNKDEMDLEETEVVSINAEDLVVE